MLNYRKYILLIIGLVSFIQIKGIDNATKTGCVGIDNHLETKEIIQYRNLFAEEGYSQDSIRNKIDNIFNQLFYGNKDSIAIYFETGDNVNGKLAYILDVNNNDVRSEGMSYGMMIAVQLNKKEIFDALWNWSKTYMYHDDSRHPAYGYFAWSLSPNGEFNDQMPAPDGEEYYATALYFASARWGNGCGIYNYKQQADTLTSHMRNRSSITGIISNKTVTGLSLFDKEYAMVRFTTDSVNANHTDASYHLPAFYEVWAKQGPSQDQAFWLKAADASRTFFEKAAHPLTSLTSDYGNFDGSAWAAAWRPESATFSYDAWRTVMNWSVDWAWWKKDRYAVSRSNRLLHFFISEGFDTYGHQYTLGGLKLDTGRPIGLVACNATAALAADTPYASQFIKALWNSSVPSGRYRYYDAMLMMMALLHCSGEFQVYL
jgi:oligosaccharide reducing-end xylanase